MLELLITFLITTGFIADRTEYFELPQEIKVEYQEVFEHALIGSEDRIIM